MKPICEFCSRVRGYSSETKISRLVRENVPNWMGTATLEKQMKEGKDLSPRHLVGVGGGGLVVGPSLDLDLLCFPLFFPSEEK